MEILLFIFPEAEIRGKLATASLSSHILHFADLELAADIPHGGLNSLKSRNLNGLKV